LQRPYHIIPNNRGQQEIAGITVNGCGFAARGASRRLAGASESYGQISQINSPAISPSAEGAQFVRQIDR
jgi:hypothetical protein